METFNIFGEDFECRNFFDIVGTSTEISGIEVYKNNKLIGTINGLSLPDQDDSESVTNFKSELQDWIFDNA